METAGADDRRSILPMRLLSPWWVAFATFFGGPLGGFTVLALNSREMGDEKSALNFALCGVAGTIILLALVFILPDNFPRTMLIPVLSVWGMRSIAMHFQGKSYDEHIAAGGRKASPWMGLAIAFGKMAIVFATILMIVFVFHIDV